MIILASGSPRRHELLQKLCKNFVVEVSDAAEVQSADNPTALAIQNATLKAQSIAKKNPDAVGENLFFNKFLPSFVQMFRLDGF